MRYIEVCNVSHNTIINLKVNTFFSVAMQHTRMLCALHRQIQENARKKYTVASRSKLSQAFVS